MILNVQTLYKFQRSTNKMQFCNNCEKSLPEDKFDLHLGYCRRNIKKCADCNRPYDINDPDQHADDFHNFQHCEHCNTQIAAQEMDSHRKNCAFKPVQCAYCEMTVPTDKYEDHRQHCEARTKPCEKCNKPIINKQYYSHLVNCQGKVYQPQPYDQSPNSYSSSSQSSSSQISSQNWNNSQSTSYHNYTYATANNGMGSPPVIRTYTRTYVQGQQASPTGTSGSSSATSYSSPSEGRIISRRVISTRVIPPQEMGSYQINSTPSQAQYTSPMNTGTTTRTYVPSTTTHQSPYSSYTGTGNTVMYGGSQSGSYDEDPQLQAALLASLGYTDINQAALYQSIQKQHQIQKQFGK